MEKAKNNYNKKDSMANRIPTKFVLPKFRLSETALSSKPIPSIEKVSSNQNLNQESFSKFLKNINYEYFRKEFTSVKEKFKNGNKRVILANPSSDIGSKRPVGMTKIVPKSVPCAAMAAAPRRPRGSKGGGGGGFKLFVLKSLIGIGAVYSTVKLGIWGTPDETQELVKQWKTAFKDGELQCKVRNSSAVMVDFVTEWSQKAITALNNLKEKIGKDK